MTEADHACHVGLAFCTPIPKIMGPLGLRLAPVTTEWHRARAGLNLPTNFNTVGITLDGMEIGEARQQAVEFCMKSENRPEFLFFLDYDVIPAYDAVTKLLMRARHFPDHDIFAGIYCSKSSPAEPLIYREDGEGAYWDWQIGDLLIDKIHACHMGLTLIRMSLFDRFPPEAWDKPMFLTVNESSVTSSGIHQWKRGTEDLFFCARATKEVGARFVIDTSVLAAHINNDTGQKFGIGPDCRPGKTPWMTGGVEYDKQKKALDLGAGATRRDESFPGYKLYTTDIRDDVGADYVQDTRLINLPDNEFDMVASSHHLEHLPRWEQESVWKEIFRIVKPGGLIEHIVPSILWAAHKIVDSEPDEHVYNVLYGAQEVHGYKREWNLHYFGFVPQVAQALAEGAGFVDVSIEDWQTNPALGYNMIIRGRKPGGAEVVAAVVPAAKDETKPTPEAAAQTEKPQKKNGHKPNGKAKSQLAKAPIRKSAVKVQPRRTRKLVAKRK